MRLPRVRFSVRRMMVAVAVVAVNFGLIRAAEDLTAYDSSLFVLLPAYALVPSLSLLTVAAASVMLGLVRQGQAPAFSTGYLLLGSLMSFGASLALATQTYMLFAVTVRDPLQDALPLADRSSDALVIVILTFPQLVPALIGGALAARHELTIVLGGRVRLPDGVETERR